MYFLCGNVYLCTMGIVFRQSVKTTIVIFVGAFLGALLIFLSTRMVPKQELGFTRNLTYQALLFSQVLLFGLQGTIAVYIHRYDNEDKRRKALITVCLLLPLLFMILGTIIYVLFKEQIISLSQPQDIPFMKRYFMWVPLFTFFIAYQSLLELYLSSQTKVAVATFMREVVLRVLNIILILLFGFNYISFDLLVAGTVMIYSVPMLLLIFFSYRTKGFGFSFDFKVFTRSEYREIFHFSWYNTLLSVSLTLMGVIDSLMLASIDKRGLSSVAVYMIATFVMSVLYIPYKAMVPAAFPDLARAFKEKNMEKAKDVFIRTSLNILITSVCLVVVVCCNLNNITAILPKGYGAVTLLVMIMVIGRVVDIATGMNDQLITASPYYKFNFYMSVMLVLLMIAFNALLIPFYSYYGAAWAMSIALTIYNIGKLIFVYAKLHILPFTANTLLVFIGAGAALVAGYFLPFILNPYVDTVVRSGVIVMVYILMLLWLKPSKDLEVYLASIKKNKRLF